MSDAEVRIVVCPQCGGPSRYEAANVYRPFCGERCRNSDGSPDAARLSQLNTLQAPDLVASRGCFAL
jgi:hypothetical protein